MLPVQYRLSVKERLTFSKLRFTVSPRLRATATNSASMMASWAIRDDMGANCILRRKLELTDRKLAVGSQTPTVSSQTVFNKQVDNSVVQCIKHLISNNTFIF
jgi:hypothetical protein